MPCKRCDTLSGHNRTCVEGQYSALVTQDRPRGPEQKDFNVLLRRSRRRPNANLPAPSDIEVRNAFHPNKGVFCGVLNEISGNSFRYRGMASCDPNCDIEISHIVHRCWHTIRRDFGMRSPATERVRVGGFCGKSSFVDNKTSVHAKPPIVRSLS